MNNEPDIIRIKRKNFTKSQRFAIFARDGFTCRYCGRQSDVVPLCVDHVIPLVQGGTNDPENLITACDDCNSGKGGRKISQTVPSEADRLRLAQDRNEQVNAAKAASEAVRARAELRQEIVNFWCSCSGRNTVPRQTISTIASYVEEFGASEVFQWIEKAAQRCTTDVNMGKYVSGIRRNVLAEREAE